MCFVFPRDFSYISLLTSCPFIYLKTSLRQQRKYCKPTVKFSSRRAPQHEQGTSVPLALCRQHRQCVAAIRPIKPLRTAFLEVSRCCVLPCSQRTEQKKKKRHSENRLVFIGVLLVRCADLASAPSGGAWNKTFALELPTQDIYLAVPWCQNCQ